MIQRPIPRASLALAALLACAAAACTPVRIKLTYRQRPPSAERAGRIRFGTLTDERRNRAEVAPDVSVVPDTPSVLETTELIVREGLAAAGWEVVPDAALHLDARLHTAWAHQTFYSVQANVQLTVELRRAGSAEPLWRHRFGVVDASGGADARTNHQDAFKKALSRLASEVAEAFGSSTFAEAFAGGSPATSAPEGASP